MRTLHSTLAGSLLLAIAFGAGAQTVVTHPGVTLASGDVRDVYIGEKQFVGAVKLVPVDNGTAQEKFLAAVVKVDVAKYNAIWTKKSFREGLSQPAAKSGDAEVLDFVRKTPGAVGYIGDASKASGVNVVK